MGALQPSFMGPRTNKSKCCIQTEKDLEKSKFCQAGYDIIIGLDKTEILRMQKAAQKGHNDSCFAYTPSSTVRRKIREPRVEANINHLGAFKK